MIMNSRYRESGIIGRYAGPLKLGSSGGLGNGLGGGRSRNRLGALGLGGRGLGSLGGLGLGLGNLGAIGAFNDVRAWGGMGALNGLGTVNSAGAFGLGNLGSAGSLGGLENFGGALGGVSALNGLGGIGGYGTVGGFGALAGGLGALGSCTMCHLHPLTGEHMCQCYNAEQLIALGQILADSCDCACCPVELNAIRASGLGGYGIGNSYGSALNPYVLSNIRSRLIG